MAAQINRFDVLLDEEQLTRVDEWARHQVDRPMRAEAVRRLMELGLAHESRAVDADAGHGPLRDLPNADQVLDVLDMWALIEDSYHALDPAERLLVDKEVAPFGNPARFAGFNGDQESAQLDMARLFIRDMTRFARLRDRELDARFPTFGPYQEMLELFEPVRSTLMGRNLSARQIIALLKR